MSLYTTENRTSDYAVINTAHGQVAAATPDRIRAEAITQLLNEGTLTVDAYGRVDLDRSLTGYERETGMLPRRKALATRMAELAGKPIPLRETPRNDTLAPQYHRKGIATSYGTRI